MKHVARKADMQIAQKIYVGWEHGKGTITHNDDTVLAQFYTMVTLYWHNCTQW